MPGFRRYALPEPKAPTRTQPREPAPLSQYQGYEIQRNTDKDAYERLKDIEERGFKRAKETRDTQTFQDKQDDRELQYRGGYGATPADILNEMRNGPSVPKFREEVLPVPKGAGITINGEFTPQPKGSRKAQVFDGLGYSDPVEQFQETAATAARKKAGLPTPVDEMRMRAQAQGQSDRLGFQEDKAAQQKLWNYHRTLGQQLRQVSDPSKTTFDDVAARSIKHKMQSVEKRLGINFEEPAPPLNPPPKVDYDFDTIEQQLRDKGASDEEIQQARQEMGY